MIFAAVRQSLTPGDGLASRFSPHQAEGTIAVSSQTLIAATSTVIVTFSPGKALRPGAGQALIERLVTSWNQHQS